MDLAGKKCFRQLQQPTVTVQVKPSYECVRMSKKRVKRLKSRCWRKDGDKKSSVILLGWSNTNEKDRKF